MPTNVPLPALGESVTEGTISRWLKAVGDTVEDPRTDLDDAALAGGPVSEQRLGEASEAIARLVRS